MFQAYFREIGLNLEIRMMEGAAFTHLISERKHEAFRWGAPGRSGANTGPDSAAKMRYSTNRANENDINDPYYDDIIHQLDVAATDEETIELLREIDHYAISQHWEVTTFPVVRYDFMQPCVKGHDGRHLLANPGQTFTRIWIE